MAVELITVTDVEIGSVGMKWPAMNGDFTLTFKHLQDIVTAANDDPHIQLPRLKLGHTSQVNGEQVWVDPFEDLGDAAPAFGRVSNLRLTNDGAVLVGDYIDVPAWVPAAYPSRSGEWLADVTTKGGKHYSMVLTAVALLGTALPAISDIEDLELLLTSGPDALKRKDTAMATEPAATRADIAQIEQSFWADFATEDRYYWWPRDIFTDPNEVIADDNEGHLFRVPFTSDDQGNVSFDDPARIVMVPVDVPDNDGDEPAATTVDPHQLRRTPVLSFTSAAQARPKNRMTTTAADAVAAQHEADQRPETHQEEATMDVDRSLLIRRFGLAEDATDEQITETLTADPAPEAEPTATSTTPEVPEGMQLIEADVLTDLQNRVAAAEEFVTTTQTAQREADRERVVNTAVDEGRITPARADHWREQYDADPAGVTETLTSLPQVLPVRRRETGVTATSTSETADTSLDTTLLTPAQRANLTARGLIPAEA